MTREVWEIKICKFCRGYGVRVRKNDYDRWDKIFQSAVLGIARREKPRKTLNIIIGGLTMEKSLCSWCNGSGLESKLKKTAH